jgi:hypothetical protein
MERKNKSWIMIVLLMGIHMSSIAQIKFGFGDACHNYNSIIVAQSIVESLGKNTLSQIIRENKHYSFVIDVSADGHVNAIHEYQYADRAPLKLIACLKKKLFAICFERYNMNKKKTEVYLKNEIQQKNGMSFNIVFPGTLMMNYELNKGLYKIRGITKYQYLINLIEKNKSEVFNLEQ